MKLIEHLKIIEQFVLDHKPPREIRTHLDVLKQHLEMEDSLLDQIAEKEVAHAKIVSDMLAAKAKADNELADMKAQKAKAEDDYLDVAQKKYRESVKRRTLHYE